MFIVLVAAFAALRGGAPARAAEAISWIEGFGLWAPAAYILAYAAACVLFLPGFLLTLGAGALWGPAKGFAVVSAASTLGAACAFLAGRYLARDWVARRAKAHPRWAAIDAAVGREGWRIVLLARLSPVFPFNLLNYGFGVTSVPFGEYLWASWLGMMPGTLLYVWLGTLAGHLARASAGRGARTRAEWAFYGLGLLAAFAVAWRVARLAKKVLDHKL